MLRSTQPVEIISQAGGDEFGQVLDPGYLEGTLFNCITRASSAYLAKKGVMFLLKPVTVQISECFRSGDGGYVSHN